VKNTKITPPLIEVFRIKFAKEFIPLFVIPNSATRFCFIVRWNQPDEKRQRGVDLYANLQPPTEI
jgi:hypothetical protein